MNIDNINIKVETKNYNKNLVITLKKRIDRQ